MCYRFLLLVHQKGHLKATCGAAIVDGGLRLIGAELVRAVNFYDAPDVEMWPTVILSRPHRRIPLVGRWTFPWQSLTGILDAETLDLIPSSEKVRSSGVLHPSIEEVSKIGFALHTGHRRPEGNQMVFLTTDISGPRGDLLKSEKGVYALVVDPSPTDGNTTYVRDIRSTVHGTSGTRSIATVRYNRGVRYNKAVLVWHLQERKDFVVTALFEANV